MTVLDHIPLRPKRPTVEMIQFEALAQRVAELERIVAESTPKRGRPAKVQEDQDQE